jgi:hypothetical protein
MEEIVDDKKTQIEKEKTIKEIEGKQKILKRNIENIVKYNLLVPFIIIINFPLHKKCCVHLGREIL